MRQDDVNELIDQFAGITLTHLSGMAARCSRDMVVRRNIDAVVMQRLVDAIQFDARPEAPVGPDQVRAGY